MSSSFFQSVGAVVRFIFSLILTAIIGVLAWFFYQQYQEQKLYNKVSTEGQSVTLKAAQVDREKRLWRDHFSNTSYISFTYLHKPYTIRYRDTAWTSAGDTIQLFYHAGLDVFRQPQLHSGFKDNKEQSGLISYSIIRSWNDERKWLILWVCLSGVFALFICGLLATLINLAIIRTIGQLIFGAMLLACAFYLTYNTWQYYRYYNRLKSEGQPATVVVINTSRHNTSRRNNLFYRYEAYVRKDNRERTIAIEEEDYESAKPGDALPVLYHRELDDLMSVHYTPGYSNVFATLFIWLLVLILGRDTVRRLRRKG